MSEDGLDPKYIVTKLDGTPVSDAVVIRHQDWFAPAVFYSYANAVRNVVDIMRESQLMNKFDHALLHRLEFLADDFISEAIKAESTPGRKFPD